MVPLSRRQFLGGVGLAALSGCAGRSAGGTTTPTSTATAAEATDGDGSGSTTDPAVPTADSRLPLSMSPKALRDAARSGGPPKDGIPSIDSPEFVAPDAIDFLDPGDPVFGVVEGESVKAYPQKILAQHEIVNDELDGTPVAVTYCPLTGTVQGFLRGETTFGVSGRLINNNLVMYDRDTETWWPQILATSIPGPWNENPEIASLREFRLIWTTWARWQRQHPDTTVLSTDTGYTKNYGRDPYGGYNPRVGYYDNDNLLFPALRNDDRYPRKTVVMGARAPEGAVAFRKESLREAKLMDGELGGESVLAVYDPRYDTGYVYRNPERREYDHGEDGVVGPDGTTHAFDALPLSRIHTFDAMWFAWAGYYPETNVYA
jgi:hypothetical protein